MPRPLHRCFKIKEQKLPGVLKSPFNDRKWYIISAVIWKLLCISTSCVHIYSRMTTRLSIIHEISDRIQFSWKSIATSNFCDVGFKVVCSYSRYFQPNPTGMQNISGLYSVLAFFHDIVFYLLKNTMSWCWISQLKHCMEWNKGLINE